MKKTPVALIPFGLVLVGFIPACGFLAAPEKRSTSDVLVPSPTPTETLLPSPTSTFTPLLPTPTRTITPVPTSTSIVTLGLPATPELAPFCSADTAASSSCQYPIAEQTGAFCSKKIPYNLVLLNPGARYEILHNYVDCWDSGTKDGKKLITCTAPTAFYFELRVCDSACTSLSIERGLVESAQCSYGYNYNNLQSCCTQDFQDVESGCVVLKLDTVNCSVDCDQYTTSSTCSSHGFYCRWNSTERACQLRK